MQNLPRSFCGNASNGSCYVSWPFSKITIATESVTLDLVINTYKLQPHEIRNFEISGNFLVQFLHIRHSENRVPVQLMFWGVLPGALKPIIETLKQAGYEVR